MALIPRSYHGPLFIFFSLFTLLVWILISLKSINDNDGEKLKGLSLTSSKPISEPLDILPERRVGINKLNEGLLQAYLEAITEIPDLMEKMNNENKIEIITDENQENDLILDDGEPQKLHEVLLKNNNLTSDLPPFLPGIKNPCIAVDIPSNQYQSQGISNSEGIVCLPSFFLFSSLPSDSNLIWDYINKHPYIIPPKSKEIRFWDQNGPPMFRLLYPLYTSYFSDLANLLTTVPLQESSNYITGDLSTTTLTIQNGWMAISSLNTANLVHSVLPSSKFIVILRNPMQRLLSEYDLTFYKKTLNDKNRILYNNNNNENENNNNFFKNNLNNNLNNNITSYNNNNNNNNNIKKRNLKEQNKKKNNKKNNKNTNKLKPRCKNYYDEKKYGKGPSVLHFSSFISDELNKAKSCLKILKQKNIDCHHDSSYSQHSSFHCPPGVLLHSVYSIFLEEWLNLFNINQFLFIQAEEFENNPNKIIKDIWKFLEVEDLNDDQIDQLLREGKNDAKKSYTKTLDIKDLPKDTYDLLDNFFSKYNKKLVKLINDDKFLWK